MKRIIINFLFLSLAILAGCEKYLEEDPKSLLSFNNLDEAKVKSAVVGIYEPLTRSRGRLFESHWGTGLNLLGEYTHSRINSAHEKLATYRFTEWTGIFNNAWPTFYQAIGRANTLIKILNDDTVLDEQLKKEALGEASFVRAIVYFQLVRGFGKVPMRLEPIADSDNTGQALAEVDDIYGQIIVDLKLAESNLPDKTDFPGKATSGAAKTALADVYLTLGRFAEAKDKAKEVMDNKSAYGYDLVSSLDILYSPTSPTSEEDIFSLKFSQFVGLGSFLPTYAAALSIPGVYAARSLEIFGADETAPLLNNWDDNDLRKKLNIFNTTVIDGVETPIAIASPNTHVFGKYQDSGAPEETAAGNDYYLYRYADVLLIFAEAENQVNGPTNAAYEAVNKIRRRAYGGDVNSTNVQADFPLGLSQSGFDDLLFAERGYEFMFEGKRWFDLKRTGKWETIIPAAGKPLPTTLYFPLPGKEILNNDQIN